MHPHLCNAHPHTPRNIKSLLGKTSSQSYDDVISALRTMDTMNVKGNCGGGSFEDDRWSVEGIEVGGSMTIVKGVGRVVRESVRREREVGSRQLLNVKLGKR